MFTDPSHVRVSDPGQVEGNVVFAYLDAFDPDAGGVSELKARYRQGGLGDSLLKRRLTDLLVQLITPIRERRAEFATQPELVRAILECGTARARDVTDAVASEVRREAFALRGVAAA
jgi:tryptophanyl-tRNA synthetase